MFISALRKNIGTIVAGIGFILLCILTFGDIGEIATEEYWLNVKNNLTSIGFMSVSLTLIQVVIRQGISEQALQRGMNTEAASAKYVEHIELIKSATERMIYLPYFLQTYNKRHTYLKKQEFLVTNNYSTEKSLMMSKRKRLIKKYNSINICIVPSRIHWATTDIVYNKNGQILTLAEYRTKRTANGVIMSIVFMFGMTLFAKGLFFTPSVESLGEKFVKLIFYILSIALGSLLSITKEYEKGAFGIPNDLDHINEIWNEFKLWTIPEWVLKEVEEINEREVSNEQSKGKEHRADIQVKQDKEQSVPCTGDSNILPVTVRDGDICISDV